MASGRVLVMASDASTKGFGWVVEKASAEKASGPGLKRIKHSNGRNGLTHTCTVHVLAGRCDRSKSRPHCIELLIT